MFTKCWLPRLVRLATPAIGKEQGCGRKKQGSLEHLWALTEVLEDCMEGRDGHASKGVYALFADVSKAYDQVWRDGLFLILYAQGLRGNLWQLIQAWLGGAVASTEWNGVQGPEVQLQQGVRQGCVLSPILYCIFINAFLAPVPTWDLPAPLRPLIATVFSQGLQDPGGRWGLYSQALKKRIAAMLYMDDTTLVATPLPQLQQIAERYVHFCRMFRLCILFPFLQLDLPCFHGLPQVSAGQQ